MSEWFYVCQWTANSKKIWTVIDSESNICLPDGEFYNRYEASRLAEDMSREGKTCKAIHNRSEKYLMLTNIRKGEVIDENNRNDN